MDSEFVVRLQGDIVLDWEVFGGSTEPLETEVLSRNLVSVILILSSLHFEHLVGSILSGVQFVYLKACTPQINMIRAHILLVRQLSYVHPNVPSYPNCCPIMLVGIYTSVTNCSWPIQEPWR